MADLACLLCTSTRTRRWTVKAGRAVHRCASCRCVWVPDGLWETRAAVKLATELGVLCAFDPLVRAPEEPHEIYYGMDVPELYLRIGGLGRDLGGDVALRTRARRLRRRHRAAGSSRSRHGALSQHR